MKHLVDMDDELLSRVRLILGTPSLKATVDAALRIAEETAPTRSAHRRSELDAWGELCRQIPLSDRSEAW